MEPTGANPTYDQRIALAESVLGKRLLEIISSKSTNLVLSADVTRKEELVNLASELGPEICVLKTHIDTLEDFDQDLISTLLHLAEKHNFLLFEDRKFSDIGNTVRLQCQGGIYCISRWAHIIDAHCIPGEGIVSGLRSAMPASEPRGLLLIHSMSSKGNLTSQGAYMEKTLEIALRNRDFVFGFIAQKKPVFSTSLLKEYGMQTGDSFLTLTPGVSLQNSGAGDALGQTYVSPRDCIIKNKSDAIIVGRAIIHASNPLSAARDHRESAWRAYLERISM